MSASLGRFVIGFCMLIPMSLASIAQESATSNQNVTPTIARGEAIYRNQCADCHGANGQGVVGTYDRPLVGDLASSQLAEIIEKTMPEGNPKACVGEDAKAVAEYVFQNFYSEAAQNRLRPPKQMFSRLTAEQFRQSISDLYASSDWIPRPEAKRGVNAEYFRSAKHRKEDKVLERADPSINFDFGKESPGAGIEPKEFSITWTGGVRPDRSGLYEIVVRSTCSFTLFFGRHDRKLIDNHVQSGDKTEFREQVYLTAGRVYPVRINFFQRERKTESPPANISVSWVIPGGVEQLIPEENWIPGWMPAQYSIQTVLPPDDRSYGFERGIKVDRDWDAAVTRSIIEFSNAVAKELWPEYAKKNKDKPNENRQILKSFLREKLNIAFHYQLNDSMATLFVDNQVDKEQDDAEAIKRVFLLGLKSPRFLYPQTDVENSSSARVDSRLAMCLLDSLPVEDQLRKAIQAGQLDNDEQVRGMARHLVSDYRSQAKMRGLIHEWLNLTNQRDRKKNAEHFAGFDDAVVQDSRRSLEAFIGDVLTSDACDYRQLLVADWGYTTKRMQQYFGDSWAPAEPFVDPKPASETEIMESRFEPLKKTANRPTHSGLLTQPYMLSGLAYFDSSSPIHRGVFILRNVLGRQIQPPQDAAFIPLSPDLHPDLTTRERVHLQTSPESCDSCHNRINSLGYTLENWDATGRFRETERNKPIDAKGYYTSREGQQVEFDGAVQLGKFAINSHDAHQAFVRRTFQHYVKQPPAAFGNDTLERLTKRFVDSQFNIRELVIEIAVIASKPTPSEKLASNSNNP
ncbi:MAG: PA14 domain-containing protein [Pirellulales bacterium]